MKIGRMILTCCCMVLLCASSSAAVHAGGNTDLIRSYELVPANPQPDTPFALRFVYNSAGLVLDSNATSVMVDGDEIIVTVGFLFASCVPLMPCPPESTADIPITGLPEGAYRLHILDDDGSPPLDASLSFAVGNPPAATIPTLDHAKMAILALLLVVAGAVAACSTRRTIRR